ncbi:MAG: CBS domain-containing protein [Thermoplasmatales archaeon]|nr:CBS domain-containing protein [Thermoplasmatales archaeon]
MAVKVKDYMTKAVVTVPLDISVRDAISIMLNSPHHSLPVVKGKGVVGFVTAKELLRHYHPLGLTVGDIIRNGTVTAHPEMSLDDAARIMFRFWMEKLPVADDNGNLVGLISNIDVLRSHIERTSPSKASKLKIALEGLHDVKIRGSTGKISIENLVPTQKRIYADELQGREYEIQKGLAEPIIVIKKKNYYLLIDGHHRVIAALRLGVKELDAHILEMDKDVELGIEKTAKAQGLRTLNDIEVIDYAHHPLVEITTRLLKRKENVGDTH